MLKKSALKLAVKKSALKLAAIATVVGSALSYSSIASAATEIKAAFNQSDKHPQYLALKEFGEKLNKETRCNRYALRVHRFSTPRESIYFWRTR